MFRVQSKPKGISIVTAGELCTVQTFRRVRNVMYVSASEIVMAYVSNWLQRMTPPLLSIRRVLWAPLLQIGHAKVPATIGKLRREVATQSQQL